MAQTQVILLERVEKLGAMGDVVEVKPGFARNYLLPQKKALRASKENVAYFEAQKKTMAAESDKQRKEAEKLVIKLEGLKVPLIRQASESGHLYGSVTSRDIAEQVTAGSDLKVNRAMVQINRSFKTIGLFPIAIQLHPEVQAEITVNIARTPEEAEIQAETGRALIADGQQEEVQSEASIEETAEEQLKDVLEETALEAEVEKQETEAKSAEEKEEAQKAKSEARAAKKAEKATTTEDDAEESEDTSEPETSEEDETEE